MYLGGISEDDTKFLYVMKSISPKGVGSTVHLDRHYTLRILFIATLFTKNTNIIHLDVIHLDTIHRQACVCMENKSSFYSHVRARMNFLEMYGK